MIQKVFLAIFGFLALAAGIYLAQQSKLPDVPIEARVFEPVRPIKTFELVNQHDQQLGNDFFNQQWTMIFLGYTHAKSSNGNNFKVEENKSLGLLKRPKFINEIELLNNYQFNNGAIIIRKSETKTKVHRKSYMLCISVKNYDSDGRCISIDTFFGFLVTKVYYMSVLNIPIIRDKIHYVIKKYGYPKDSYNAKELVSALEDFPRSELLQISQND